MLAALFYVLGALSILGGGFWIASAVVAAGRATASNGAALAAILVASPGFVVMIVGLLFLAIAAGLHRLERIDRNTKNAAVALRELADR
jgi:UPF0716 family protein affecting phage T7 exclusion